MLLLYLLKRCQTQQIFEWCMALSTCYRNKHLKKKNTPRTPLISNVPSRKLVLLWQGDTWHWSANLFLQKRPYDYFISCFSLTSSFPSLSPPRLADASVRTWHHRPPERRRRATRGGEPMEVSAGDEELQSLLQNFHRVSQVRTCRGAQTAARPRTAYAVHLRSVSIVRFGFDDLDPRF